MTLGKKLSNYRKLSGMTQQQLGDRLNLSSQAISKWENDLAEPDLGTLRTLARIYRVTVDELLDISEANPIGAKEQPHALDTEAVAEAISERIETSRIIGFCKSCGITVTEENVGTRTGIIKCSECSERERRKAERERQERLRAEEEARKAALEEQKRRINRLRFIRKKSLKTAAIPAAILLLLGIIAFINSLEFGVILVVIPPAALAYCFTAMLFYDTPVTSVIANMCTASVRWPGLIFEWSIDGFIWLICMKLLFAVLGFLIGLISALLGIAIGLLISPFVFVYIMRRLSRDIKRGEGGDYLWDKV